MAKTFNITPFQELRLPDDEGFQKLAEKLKLTQEQSNYLRHTITKAFEVCQSYLKQREQVPDRDRLTTAAMEIEKLLAALQKKLKLSKNSVAAISVPENMGALGRLLTFETLADIFGTDAVSSAKKRALERSERFGLTPEELEREFEQEKQMLDVHGRPQILLHLVEIMRSQFAEWLKIQTKVLSGREPNWVREVMIASLAYDAPHILGSKLKRKGGTRFLNLCHEVFWICEIDDTGLEAAIEYFLAKKENWDEVSFWNDISS